MTVDLEVLIVLVWHTSSPGGSRTWLWNPQASYAGGVVAQHGRLGRTSCTACMLRLFGTRINSTSYLYTNKDTTLATSCAGHILQRYKHVRRLPNSWSPAGLTIALSFLAILAQSRGETSCAKVPAASPHLGQAAFHPA